jgi:ketosteroid isomerase-like protein
MFKKLMVLFCTMACSMSIAQGAAASPTDDEREVAAAVEKLRTAMTHPADAKLLEQLAMDDLSYGHSHGKLQNKLQFIADLTNGASDFVSITLSDQTIQVVQDVAIVRHTLNAVTNDSGKPGTVSLKILLVWKKDDGQWRLLARQAVHSN